MNVISDAPTQLPQGELVQQLLAQIGREETLAQKIGFAEQHCEAAYGVGYSLYESQHFEDASRLFEFLVLHQPKEPRYLFAYASSLQMCGDYVNAVWMYVCVLMSSTNDLRPYLYIAQCFFALGMKDQGIETLDVLIGECEDGSQEVLRDRAIALRALINPPTSPATGKEIPR
jgi:hypothetical protein